jgi:proton-coupled amino acid transporter
MHMLCSGAEYLMKVKQLDKRPDYAECVGLSFEIAKNERVKKMSNVMMKICNLFICLTQLGFCCVYILFAGRSIFSILEHYGIMIDFEIVTTIMTIPIWITALVRQLKNIAIFSAIANVCMIVGAVLTIGYSTLELPSITERYYYKLETLPLFFGTVLFAFVTIK